MRSSNQGATRLAIEATGLMTEAEPDEATDAVPDAESSTTFVMQRALDGRRILVDELPD